MGSDYLLSTGFRYVALMVLGMFSLASGYFIAENHYNVAWICVVFALTAAWLLNWIYRHTHRSVSYFFRSLKNDDTSLRFPEIKGNQALKGIYEGMNALNKHWHDIRLKNEYHEKYLRMLIRHSAAGLLVLNGNNEVELINDQASRYAGIPPESTNLNLLKVRNPMFYEAVCRARPGDSQIYRQTLAGQVQVLSFKTTFFTRNTESLKLISIQDIRRELDTREGESYRKLISVLTHEIMNLMAPITSVAGVLDTTFGTTKGPSRIGPDEMKTARNSIAVIRDQSAGISRFLANYRKIAKVPEPETTSFDAAEWLDQLRIAFSGRMQDLEIRFDIIHDKALLRIEADKSLLNQLMINLLNNAIEAVSEHKSGRFIRIRLERTRINGVRITVTNNGPVIPAERLDRIFVPFYTTKKEGSGIGLGICQEIMRVHHGTMTVVSGPEDLTSFVAEL